MSHTSASEPPIMATQIEVLENAEETEAIKSYVRNHLCLQELLAHFLFNETSQSF